MLKMTRKFISVYSLFILSTSVSAGTYDLLIAEKSSKYGLDPHLVHAVIGQESGFNYKARSPKNARGLMQVIPGTAERMGIRASDLYVPERNIEAGTRYLAYLSRLFKGHLPHLLAAYNAGEGAVFKYGGIPPYKETRAYVPAVLGRYQKLKNGTADFNISMQSSNAYFSTVPLQAKKKEEHFVTDLTKPAQDKPVANTQPRGGNQDSRIQQNLPTQQPATPVQYVQAQRNFVVTLQTDGTYQ